MAIITISRGCCSKGQEIAEKVAGKLGYSCLSREVLLAASEEFNVPEVKLEHVLHDPLSVLDRITHGRERYIAFIRQVFLEQMREDNVVYHGLAGHFFVEGIEHVLKVRVIADLEDRVGVERERNGISRHEAEALLKKDDEERRRWSLELYGIDTSDPHLYDLVVHLHKIGVEGAVEIICHTAQLPQLETTAEARQALDNLVLAAQVKNTIVKQWPKAEVSVDDGEVVVEVPVPGKRAVEKTLAYESKVYKDLSHVIGVLPGVKQVKVNVRPAL